MPSMPHHAAVAERRDLIRAGVPIPLVEPPEEDVQPDARDLEDDPAAVSRRDD
jgi:hypothetical protein